MLFEKESRGQAHDSVKYVAGAVETAAVAGIHYWRSSKCKMEDLLWWTSSPLYTGGWRKDDEDTERMRIFLEPFSRYNVDSYLCGHEHHLKYTKPEGKTHYIISGAAW